MSISGCADTARDTRGVVVLRCVCVVINMSVGAVVVAHCKRSPSEKALSDERARVFVRVRGRHHCGSG